MASPLRADARRVAARPELALTEGALMRPLVPIMLVVLVAYLIIGLAMPVLPLYVHQELGFSTFMVGVAAGIEFVSALASRFWAGRFADTTGAKPAMIVGLLMGAAAGLL